jgi:hypothetical protein
MSHYDTNDEYDVAQGISDALRQRLPATQSGAEWLGWKIGEPSLGEIERLQKANDIAFLLSRSTTTDRS